MHLWGSPFARPLCGFPGGCWPKHTFCFSAYVGSLDSTFLKCYKRLISVFCSDNFNISAYGKEKCYLHYSLIFSKLFLDNPQDGIMVMLVVSLMLLSKMASIHPCKKTVLGKVFG